ncbi:hypothetical protein Pla175_01710 [Pirellulimonas nuda]|uniref:PEP-CTERM protein-sorting domain-containing protein n=1 Tax=Pirellulimonas nuda TaxID=2528009 RepID=A0A518D5R8_9BACT|nr:hypothetical protein [Pirellulimonas nuda]QDU86818.1 hypothetical protein Pla175_01710 [Pirellulimonas nuda]
MIRHNRFLLAAAAAALVATPLQGALTPFDNAMGVDELPTTTGDVVLLSFPPSIAIGMFEANGRIALFQESLVDLNFSPELLDGLGLPGAYSMHSQLIDLNNPPAADIGVAQSWLLHFDPELFPIDPDTFEAAAGSVTFPHPIRGFSVRASSLLIGNFIAGDPTVDYGPPGALDFPLTELPVSDSFTISPDRHTLTVSFRATTNLDRIRVFTAPIPEPSAWVLALVGAAACLAVGRNKTA